MTGKIKIKKFVDRRTPWFAWHTSCALRLPPGEYTAWAAITYESALSWTNRHIRIHERAGR